MLIAVLNIVFAGIAGLAILAALYFGGRAAIQRGRSPQSAYNVGRQQARQSMQIDLIRALAAIVLALIFLGAFGLTPRPVEPLIPPTEPILIEATATPTEPAPITPTDQPTEIPSTPTPELVRPTVTRFPTLVPTVTATETVENVQETAVVSSGVGVWLRNTPSTTGEQLEWLLDGTVLIVLDGQETADNLAWQEVQTAEGFVGWVAVPFIVYADEQ